jgi:hypothetical protein
MDKDAADKYYDRLHATSYKRSVNHHTTVQEAMHTRLYYQLPGHGMESHGTDFVV